MSNAQPNNLLDKVGLIPGSLKVHKTSTLSLGSPVFTHSGHEHTLPPQPWPWHTCSWDRELGGKPVIYSLGSLLAQSLPCDCVGCLLPSPFKAFFSLHFCDVQICLSAELLPTHSLPTLKVLPLAWLNKEAMSWEDRQARTRACRDVGQRKETKGRTSLPEPGAHAVGSRAYTGDWLPLEGYMWLQMWAFTGRLQGPGDPRSGPYLRAKRALGRLTREVKQRRRLGIHSCLWGPVRPAGGRQGWGQQAKVLKMEKQWQTQRGSMHSGWKAHEFSNWETAVLNDPSHSLCCPQQVFIPWALI